MTHLVVIRPEPGNSATVAEARAMGLEAVGFPLFDVVPVEWDGVDPSGYDALLLGSANAVHHAGAGLDTLRTLPAYAVGEATARAAQAAGLRIVATGSGGLQSVLAQLQPGHRRLLRLCGRERMALSPPPGVGIEERVVYAAEPLPLPDALADLLHGGAVVLLHSAEAARHFAAQCDARGLDRASLAIATLGPRIAEAAGRGWLTVRSAAQPRDRALLALAGQMCQECARSKTG
jgi:uroporphyrinogen-III synthase